MNSISNDAADVEFIVYLKMTSTTITKTSSRVNHEVARPMKVTMRSMSCIKTKIVEPRATSYLCNNEMRMEFARLLMDKEELHSNNMCIIEIKSTTHERHP